jgi:hypothetical protein
MASMDEIGQEKQRISERLARFDAERTRLGDQLNELEIAERVLTRFGGKADTTGGRSRYVPLPMSPVRTRPHTISPVEGVGFEPSVPLKDDPISLVKEEEPETGPPEHTV